VFQREGGSRDPARTSCRSSNAEVLI
jgi:hypothetical protein